jgi:hypothetical protein
MNVFRYLFGSSPVPQPGTAYHSPLQQFQEYPQNRPQGHGVIVGRQSVLQSPQIPVGIVPVVSAGNGSGTVQGQIIFQPLVIVSNQVQ